MIKTLIVVLLGLMFSQTFIQATFAYTLIKADESDCVQEVIPASGMPAGFVTNTLEKGVFVKTCTGDYAAVKLVNNQISFNEVKTRVPSRELKGQKDGLLDSEVSSSKTIKAAWLTGSTRRYRHGVLGDDTEASGFSVIDRKGKRYDFKLDNESVFEDRKVRIADLNNDGKEEFIVVRSYLNSGAALSVYGVRNEKLVLVAETSSIGTPNRWLNPAVVADVDNDGKLEIAYVQTPHIGGILHVLNLVNDKLIYKYKTYQNSNHGIGSRVQELAAAVDWNADGVPEIVLPNASRTAMKVVSYTSREPKELESIDLGGSILTRVVAADLDGDENPEVYLAVENGRFLVLRP